MLVIVESVEVASSVSGEVLQLLDVNIKIRMQTINTGRVKMYSEVL